MRTFLQKATSYHIAVPHSAHSPGLHELVEHSSVPDTGGSKGTKTCPCSQTLTVSRSLPIKKENILCSGCYILKISN